MTGVDEVRGLQERAARGLPAGHVEEVGAWRLRYAPGCAWWVGTVQPHGGAGRGGLARRIGEAERFYAGHAARARFQITPGVCPGGLDTALAERGYRRESPMSLQVASTAEVLERAAATGAAEVRCEDRPTPAWFDAWRAVHGRGVDARAERDLLDRVDRPSAYVSVLTEGEVVAVSRAVADTGWAGVFGMATLPQARGRGAARRLLAALAAWARTHAADRMYLQVERDNPAALRLYGRSGFGEVRGYHYRTAG